LMQEHHSDFKPLPRRSSACQIRYRVVRRLSV